MALNGKGMSVMLFGVAVFIYIALYFVWRWQYAIPFRIYQSYDESISGRYFEWIMYDSNLANESDDLLALGKVVFYPVVLVEERMGTLELVSE